MKSNKSGQGEVVATVLLILLTISAAVMIIGFVIPFIREKLDKSCFDYNGMIEIKNNEKYTCYNPGSLALDDERLSLRVSVGDLDKDVVKLNGYIIVVETNMMTERFVISKSLVSPGVVSFSGAPITPTDIPERNAEKTYNFTLYNGNQRPNSTTIYPILENGKECSEANYQLNFIPYC